jgi:F-type H+-transporting ATPase subunit epsilon
VAGDKLELEIVTPEGVQLHETIDELTAPSVDGEFGVLPGHRPLLAALQTGLISFRVGNKTTQVAVGPGFVEIHQDKAVVLTDKYSTKAQIDPVRVRLELKDADTALDNFNGEPKDPEYLDLVQRELWAASLLELYGDPPPPTIRNMTMYPPSADDPVQLEGAGESDATSTQAAANH